MNTITHDIFVTVMPSKNFCKQMQNPSYSRFTNTRTDLNDCLDAIRKDVHLSDAETSAGKEMFKVFLSLCQDYGMIEGFDCGKVDSVFDHLENCSEALTE